MVGLRLPRAGYDPTLIIYHSYHYIFDDPAHEEKFNFCPECGVKL
jgi:hypothetical protein